MTNAVETQAPISPSERCDRCSAQAKVRATLVSGELYFCGHHARETAPKLVPQSIQIFDPEGCING